MQDVDIDTDGTLAHFGYLVSESETDVSVVALEAGLLRSRRRVRFSDIMVLL